MSGLIGDVRFGLRLLARSPVFTATAALLLAVGISANALIFSVVNALLWRPLPVSHAESLVRLVEVHPNEFVTWDLPYNLCDAAAARDADLTEAICQGSADVAYRDGALAEQVRVHLVSPNFFSSLGVPAWTGRTLTADDERSAAMVAVVSYGFWRRNLSAYGSVTGRSITLAGHPFTIVGVMPESFNGLATDTSPDIRVPAATDRYLIKRDSDMGPAARPLFGQIFGRLRSGVSLQRASANADAMLGAALQEETEKIFPELKAAGPGRGSMESHLRLESIRFGVSMFRGPFSRSLELLMGAVALLLLTACANIAGLLLARAAQRAPEMGVRLALGAGAGRILRQLFTEGLLLSFAGGAGGIVLTVVCLPLLTGALPAVRDRAAVLQSPAFHVALDLRVLGFALAVTVISAVLMAMSPGLHGARTDIMTVLRTGRAVTGRLPARSVMVTVQVAFCTLILLTAAMLSATLAHMRSMNAGFDRDRVVTLTIDPELNGYTAEQARTLRERLLQRAREMTGVEAAGIATVALMRGTGMKATFGAAGSRITAADFLNSSSNSVTPGYFETMGMRLRAGRWFNRFDQDDRKPRQVIVNQRFAERFFGVQDPLGRAFGFPGPGGVATSEYTIIGVVSDARYRSLREPVPPTVYNLMGDKVNSRFVLHVRTDRSAESMLAPLRGLVRSLDAGLPVIEARTLREEVESSLWQERLLALLSGLFGAIAAVLAGIGLYGALDYAVKSSTREIGMRMALGAPVSGIVGLFSREALVLTAAGATLGIGGYAAASAWIERALFGVRAWEPGLVIAAVAAVGLVAAMAAVPAAWRAARVDPASALRGE